MSMYGIDISNWQAGFNLDAAIDTGKVDFVILKASEYGWGKDKCFDGWASVCKRRGIRFGAYMFARQTSYGSVDQQVDFFISACGSYLKDMTLVLDWEDTSYSSVQGNVGLCRQFLDTIKRKTGKTPMLYTSQSEVRYNDYSSIKNAGYPLWGACYLYSQMGKSFPLYDPALPSGGWGAYGSRPSIYQYGDGWLLGWDLDVNCGYLSASDWDKLAGGGSPSPQPTPSGKLDVDGVAGYLTIKRLQELQKSPHIDGTFSGQYQPNSKFYPAITAVQFDGGSGDSWSVKKLQAKLGVEQDGVLGRATITAWQKRLKKLGYDIGSAGADGIFGSDSAKALQRCLNDKKW